MEMNDLFTVVDLALLKAEWIELHGKSYVKHDSIIDAIYTDDAATGDDYQSIVDYLGSQRSAHALGSQFEFLPPVVEYAQRGIYFEKFDLPREDDVIEALKTVMPKLESSIQKCSYKPVHELGLYKVQRAVIREYYLEREDSLANEHIADVFEKYIISYVTDHDWYLDDESMTKRFMRPLHINYAEGSNARSTFDGEMSIRRDLAYRMLSRDAYGVDYYLQHDEWTAEFHQYVEDVVAQHGYLFDEAANRYNPKPIELPENIVEIGYEILGDEGLLLTSIYGSQIIPLFTLRDQLQRHRGIIISEKQIIRQLTGSQGLWREPLVMLGYQNSHTSARRDHYPGEGITDYTFDCVAKLMMAGEVDTTEKAEFALGLPVTVRGYCVDDNTNTLVHLDIAGSYNAVEGNWAEIMQDKMHTHKGVNFKVGTAANHDVFRGKLPSGLYQYTFIHRDAAPHVIDTTSLLFYMISENGTSIPDGFYESLNRFVTTPILPQWETYLWVLGRSTGLITPATAFNKLAGPVVWRIKRGGDNSNWTTLIETSVASERIGF